MPDPLLGVVPTMAVVYHIITQKCTVILITICNIHLQLYGNIAVIPRLGLNIKVDRLDFQVSGLNSRIYVISLIQRYSHTILPMGTARK